MHLSVREQRDPQTCQTARPVAVTTLLDNETRQVSPQGTEFTSKASPLFDRVRALSNPQAVVAADFNADGLPDVALPLAEANSIVIRLNDGSGGFSPDQIEVALESDAAGPVSLAVGQFNGHSTPLDLAVTNLLTSNVTIFSDFDGSGFVSQQSLVVGEEPSEIIAAEVLGRPNHLDLIVLNGADRTIQLLHNDGEGGFDAQAPIATGGQLPTSIVAIALNDDDAVDIAVSHAPFQDSRPIPGDIRVLLGDGEGSFVLQPERYEVGETPVDLTVANFDNDPGGQLDLAVSNASSNSISILTSNPDGTLTVQPDVLGTPAGALDIASADIDNDGDVDVVASNPGRESSVSIFRNVTTREGVTRFEPLEAIGLAQLPNIVQRVPLVLANFDGDRTQEQGTIDILAVQSARPETLTLLANSLVQGVHRVALTGQNQVVGLDFRIAAAQLPPSIDPITGPIVIPEDAAETTIPLSGIQQGRVNGPPLRIVATSSDPTLVPDPSVVHAANEATGLLRFTPQPNANGTATITVSVTDAGANGVFDDFDDVLATRNFEVVVESVNDAPTLTLPKTVTLNEDAGPQTIESFVIDVGPGGGPDEATQSLSDFVISTDTSFFSTPPTIDPGGRLGFTTAQNVSGPVTVEVTVIDNGGSERGGQSSVSAAFVLNVLPVNDQPTISIGNDLVVEEGSGPRTIAQFAEGFLPGGGEGSQVIAAFLVTNDNDALFAEAPRISTDGTLTFTPTTVAAGVANVFVQVRDSGGTQRWGVELSQPQSFTITVTRPSNVLDFGDAPDSFPSLLADNGARHIVGTLRLGSEVTTEVDRQTDNGDADDGVFFPVTTIAGNSRASTSSVIVVASQSGVVDAWIDFNRDGDWSDEGEQILDSIAVSAGSNTLPYTVPPGAVAGEAFTRFRISSTGGLSLDGIAGDGEVEDYPLRLADPNAAPDIVVSLGELASGLAESGLETLLDLQITLFEESLQVAIGGVIVTTSDRSAANGITIADSLGTTLGRIDSGVPITGSVTYQLRASQERVDAGVLVVGAEASLDLTALDDPDLLGITEIRLADGVQQLALDAASASRITPTGELVIRMDNDGVTVGSGWNVDGVTLDDNNRLVRRISQPGISLLFDGPDDYTNPINRFDVNGNGDVTSGDVLQIINELARRQYSDTDGSVLDPTTVDRVRFRFYDANGDRRISVLDALQVVNHLGRLSRPSPSGEYPAGFSFDSWSRVDRGSAENPQPALSADLAAQPKPPRVKSFGMAETRSPESSPLEAEAEWHAVEAIDSVMFEIGLGPK